MTRAREPDSSGFVERDGVRLFHEVHGEGDTTILLLPTWSIMHSRMWKGQVPYLARHFRVVTFDGRGNGRSDRPRGPAAYAEDEFAADALAVMDATSTARAVLVALSCGTLWGALLAADHPERVAGLAAIGPAVPLAPGHPERAITARFEEELDTHEGWARYNRHAFARDYDGFLSFFFAEMFHEPFSTKPIEDCIGWAHETDPATLADATSGLGLCRTERFAATCARVRCPVLVVHGDEDRLRPHAQGAALAAATGGRVVTLGGSGHGPHARDPVAVNLLLREFAGGARPCDRTLVRAPARPRRALFVTSPIGLGHVRRDLAIAHELRARHPDLEIEWLTQHPVTAFLEAAGETMHPAGAHLASESAHLESEAGDHELAVFASWRRMDEILLANFMVFLDVVREREYDVWIGDEAWEVDHFLHENPQLKTAAYVWLTDFVGWVPAGADAALVASHNGEMVAQVSRYPRVRDRALFVGDPEDVVPGTFGPGLPEMRAWTEEHFAFTGYIADEPAAADRAALGWAPEDRVCVVTAGGSGVGAPLLRRVMAAFPQAKALVDTLRMVVVAGPRVAPVALPPVAGVEVHAFVPDLPRHLAACDLAVAQGGLATAMELVAARRPALLVPLLGHCEQQVHVRHRVERHRGGRYLDFATDGPDAFAQAIAEELGRPVDPLPIRPGGAARAADAIAELL